MMPYITNYAFTLESERYRITNLPTTSWQYIPDVQLANNHNNVTLIQNNHNVNPIDDMPSSSNGYAYVYALFTIYSNEITNGGH